ncbi:hypothetical protein PMJ10TS2_07520 [Paenibacillus melissococcoides]
MKKKVDILKVIALQKQLLSVERGEGNEKQTGWGVEEPIINSSNRKA